jgi:hypothetical protein
MPQVTIFRRILTIQMPKYSEALPVKVKPMVRGYVPPGCAGDASVRPAAGGNAGGEGGGSAGEADETGCMKAWVMVKRCRQLGQTALTVPGGMAAGSVARE